MNTWKLSIWIATASLVVAPANASEPGPAPGEGSGLVPSFEGLQATCSCQGNGKVAECSGNSCSCSQDWAGDPECTANDGSTTALQVKPPPFLG